MDLFLAHISMKIRIFVTIKQCEQSNLLQKLPGEGKRRRDSHIGFFSTPPSFENEF